jgi:hydrogenase maturation protein HypF
MNKTTVTAKYIIIKGLVQGIGFRPFIYRVAEKWHITGWVENRSDSVWVKAQGAIENIEAFITAIKNDAPLLTRIESLDTRPADREDAATFNIRESKDDSQNITHISPDIAVCPECLEDIQHHVHRIQYPFINCTLCGPRFSIIEDLPYDREKTTMKPFDMCDQCKSEYNDIGDRRFHAQPVACNNCGPVYELWYQEKLITDFKNVLIIIRDLLMDGNIIAVKGIGGYHLACNAFDEKAVQLLRSRKKRDHKPFAIMFSNLEKLKEYAYVSKQEEVILTSPVRPIVLLKAKKNLVKEINSGLDTIGVLLPYMPFHYMLFEQIGLPALVFTSGNFSEEPIVIDNKVAVSSLTEIADAILTHNRDIYNRVDDSVVSVTNNKVRISRRSRGFVPSPIALKLNVDGIVAAGAELKNCFALGKGNTALISQHIGDLKTHETYEFYTETLERFKKLFRVTPNSVACDMHPDYLSTRYSIDSGLPLERVQHHHAHIASCLAEHSIDEQVIGISFDGIGYGDDETLCGGEILLCDLKDYKRYSHLETVAMPGGDRAAEEPWRMAVSYLYKIYGRGFLDLPFDLVSRIPHDKIEMVITAIERGINTPLTSSVGRLFDAVSSMLGICHVHTFEAEAAMRLETFVDNSVSDIYTFVITEHIETTGIIKGIVDDLSAGKSRSYISTKFHNTLIRIIHESAENIRKETGITMVALSGGTFQNRHLLANSENILQRSGFSVYANTTVPCNDGGIALGQLAVAAKRRELSCV